MTKKQTPSPLEQDVLRRMLNTPPVPHVAPKPKPKKPKKQDK